MAIQKYAEAERCSVVEDFCGHGLGRLFHDEPNILHYAVSRKAKGWQSRSETQVPEIPLKPGMIFTVEPMINLGVPDVKILKRSRRDGIKQEDGWTAETRDGKLSAQFEHSVGVTETGVEIFTISPGGLHKPPYAVTSVS
jgi:methionyl aminopeptidase